MTDKTTKSASNYQHIHNLSVLEKNKKISNLLKKAHGRQ